MSRALAVAAAITASAAAVPVAPARAEGDPRADRAELLVRIADLSDRVERAQIDVVRAQTREAAAGAASARTRAKVREHAVAAYMHGTGVPDSVRLGPAVYLEVAARKQREILRRAVTATEEAEQAQRAAEAALGSLRKASAELDRAREQLDVAVAADDARRAEDQRRADEARRRALLEQQAAATTGGIKPRHREATQRQVELMKRYPFGVLPAGTALPAGLRGTGQRIEGLASWYGPGFHGRATASGAIYDQEGWTTASRDLPLGTMLVVSRGGTRVLLLVNDRGPYVYDRVLDLSHGAAAALGVGVDAVVAEVVVPA